MTPRSPTKTAPTRPNRSSGSALALELPPDVQYLDGAKAEQVLCERSLASSSWWFMASLDQVEIDEALVSLFGEGPLENKTSTGAQRQCCHDNESPVGPLLAVASTLCWVAAGFRQSALSSGRMACWRPEGCQPPVEIDHSQIAPWPSAMSPTAINRWPSGEKLKPKTLAASHGNRISN